MVLDYSTCLLRLTDLEREKLQLVVAALKVSEYTNDVDDFRRPYDSRKRMVHAMVELFDIITGLAVASDVIPKSTKNALLAGESKLSVLVPLLEELFEILRRHKRLNPFSHREEYGKLLMLLQDVQNRLVSSVLGIESNLVIPCRTVGSALREIGAEELLNDKEMTTVGYLRKRGREKEEGMKAVVDKYGGEDPRKREVVERCLRSMDDVHQFLQSNCKPLWYLSECVKDEFQSINNSGAYNLSITAGRGGACFSHNHKTQCQYVRESLYLWETVQWRIFELWEAAESDMLVGGGRRYDFVNTGQGYHRMCVAPKSYSTMSACVQHAEHRMGGWVGIKVIHLGDHDVPNPLVFIDKYTVIPHIVQPIVHVLHELRRAFGVENCEDEESAGETITYPGLKEFLESKYGNYKKLKMMILSDFFKHAFDGSGDDGGSCIDGRLTSAWNWCHELHNKPYYDAFVLTGFNGFD
ncbi:unnamed protein product [Phytomonas sp. Hart1]|nr:unnamed protein product [Phytomonas sp. Hart1]|eukprot:CCW69267.1 unnamed protein product [Phytomonas sp. isolate Hart1]